MHFTDAAVFPRLVWTARTAGKGISIGTDVISRVSFQFILKKTYFYVQNLHAVIYLIFCIFSLNLFIVRIVFFIACCDIFVVLLLFVEIKALLGLCYMFVNIRQKIKFLCLCLCLCLSVITIQNVVSTVIFTKLWFRLCQGPHIYEISLLTHI